MSKPIHSLTVALWGVPLVGLALAPAAGRADTIYVCWDGSGDYVTVQEGIDAAQGGDQVVVCDGTYTGSGNKDLDFGGKLITVRSENGPDNCIIDCEHDGRGFYFHSAEDDTSVVDGFTISNGFVGYDSGGGICCVSNSSPTITNCTIRDSFAGRGGGVHCELSDPAIENCTIAENSAESGGGMSCVESSPTIANCTITGNSGEWCGGGVYCEASGANISDCTITANNGTYAGGGVLCEDSTSTIANCRITHNLAEYGAGICCNAPYLGRNGRPQRKGGDPLIENCAIAENSADSNGGGLCCYFGNPTITNCTITSNDAYDDGGGICCGDYPTITNCTITENSAGSWGGGITCDASPTITNCTIAGNEAGYAGGGIECENGSPTVANCILWADTPEEIYPGDYGDPVVRYSDVQGDWPGDGNIDADPLFVDPDGPDDDPNTWEDNDYHLSGGSPCIDAGCNWGVPPDTADLDEDGDTTEFTPLDLDGEGRFFDDPNTPDTGRTCPPIVDMGAYEFGDTGPQPCPGDLDCDRTVRQSDLGILLAAWQLSNQGDLNCDGVTDESDLGILLAHWGESCP
jgi:hypothetical protein